MNIAEFIFTNIRKKLPTINWNLGSVVRELIVTPLVTAADIVNNALAKQTNAFSVDSYIKEPEIYADNINQLFYDLDLQDNPVIEATGVITILTTSNTPSAVYQNTTMYYNDIPITVASDVFPGLVNDGVDNFAQLRQIGYKSYAFDVPVVATGVSACLTIGTPIIWHEAPEDVYAITVTSPVSGGRTTMSLLEKALKIKDYLAPSVVTLNEGILKLLKSKLSDIVVDAAFAQDVVTDAHTTYLYVKTKKAPGYYIKSVEGARTSSGLYNITGKVPGLVDVKAVFKDNKIVNIQQLQIENNNIYCLVECDSTALTESFDIQVYGISDAEIIQGTIDNYFLGSPYKLEVKAPDIFNVTLDFAYTGAEITNIDVNNICEYIQNMPMNSQISDSTLDQLLNTYGARLEGTCSYAISNTKGLYYKQKISPFIYSKNYSYFAIYTGQDKVKATYVQ